MRLQGHELSLRMEGDDVQRLHQELALLGYKIQRNEQQEKVFGEGTENAVRDFQRKRGLAPTGRVNPHTARLINAAVDALPPRYFVVNGQVVHQDRSRLEGITVRAFDKDLRREEELGTAATGDGGAYQISYTSDQFTRAEKIGPDLIVRAFTPEGKFLAESEIAFNAPAVFTVNLIVAPRVEPEEPTLSEYEQLVADLEPVLDGESPDDLDKPEIIFLEQETGIDVQRITFLVQAATLFRQTDVHEAIFYGLARRDVLPLELDALRQRDLNQLRRALTEAIRLNIIPSEFHDKLDELLKQLLEPEEVDDRQEGIYEFVGRLERKQKGNDEEEAPEPLVGYTVRAFDTQNHDELTGYDISDGDGLFEISYVAPNPRDDDDDVSRRLRLRILDRHLEEIHQTVIDAKPGQKQPQAISVPVTDPVEPPSPTLDDISRSSAIDLPAQLIDRLAAHNIHTLVDIRKEGGISHLEGLPVPPDDRAVQVLEAHASLSVLSTDVQHNAKLIDKQYASVRAIATTARAEFVNAFQNELGDFAAAQLHEKAVTQSAYLDNLATHLRADLANGFQPALDDNRVLDLFSIRCGCDDCEAAVSPLAYLADLLDYVLTHVKNNGQPINLRFLELTFRQPFGDLPASCESVEEQVRQVRICIEVLRRYISARTNPGEEAEYRLAAYDKLLTQVGTTYTELRLVQRAEESQRQALANRLGIAPHRLGELFLEPAAITEEALQRLFGLAATITENNHLLNPLRNLATPEVQVWREDYLRTLWYQQNWPADRFIEQFLFHADPLFQNDLDNGQIPPGLKQAFANQGIVLSLQATVTVQTPGELWTLHDGARSYWIKKPADQLGVYSERELPLIDPDVMGPDDMRQPEDGAEAFDAWRRRRDWVDQLLTRFEGMQEDLLDDQGNRIPDRDGNPIQVPDYQQMVQAMSGQVTYDAHDGAKQVIPWPSAPNVNDLEALFKQLDDGTTIDQATERIEGELKLSTDAFTRLVETIGQARAWEADRTKPEVEADQWREVHSILAQACKQAFFPAWIREERETLVNFDSQTFWISLREPQEGAWPMPARQGPLVDPDIVARDELPDYPFAGKVIQLWDDRKDWLEDDTWLETRRNQLRTDRENNGYLAILEVTYGAPLPPAIDELWNLLNQDLSEDDPDLVAVIARIRNELLLEEASFRTLMEVRDKDAVPNGQVTHDEWESVYDILAGVLRRQLPDRLQWAGEEQGLLYWHAFKARLPKWRAHLETRRHWQDSLRWRGSLPIVDPNHIDVAHDFKPPVSQNAAFMALYMPRRQWVEQQLDDIRTEAHGPDELDWLDTKIQQHVGVTLVELADLDQLRQAGDDITTRLAQLLLSRPAFDRLLRVRRLLADNEPVLNSEWDDVYAILVQTSKQRHFATWRDFERDLGITLSPDFFQVERPPKKFPAPEPSPLPAWLAIRQQRRDWLDTLQARIDQEQSISRALQQAVAGTEEVTLPMLRDALIRSAGVPQPKAKQLSDRLLIDTEADGCQMTTRISQAIETLQGLLWSIRTGQLQDTYPDLSLDADHFEEEWKWIGSYATWRAAMFVFLYPENILLPALRRQQTPAFRKLVHELRANRRLTPEDACQLAKDYEDYFRDVCQLSVEATCMARTRVQRGSCRDQSDTGEHDLFYMFARGQETNTVYWSSYDGADDTAESQSFWQPIHGLEHATKLIGAVPYHIDDQQRFVYLFLLLQEKGNQKLGFHRYHLEQQRWDAEPTLLEEMPEEAIAFTAIVKQHQRVDRAPHLAVRVESGAIYDRSLNREGNDWSDEEWRELVGETQGADFSQLLAVVENGENSFLLFVSDPADRIYYEEFRPGLLDLKPGPGVYYNWFWRLLALMRGSDDALYSNDWDDPVWKGWQSLGGYLTSDPVGVANNTGSLTPGGMPKFVFALGRNNELYYASLDSTPLTWHLLQLTDAGVVVASKPSVVYTEQGHSGFVDVFARGSDNAIWHRRLPLVYDTAQNPREWTQEQWENWHRLGHVVDTAPAASAFLYGQTNLVDLFALNADSELLRIEYDLTNGTTTEVNLGGAWSSDVAVIRGLNRRYVFVRGPENDLHYFDYHRIVASSNPRVVQGEWQKLEGQFASSPAGASQHMTLHILARGEDDSIRHGRLKLGDRRKDEEDRFLEWQSIPVGNVHQGDHGWTELGIGTWLGAFQWAQSDFVYAFWRQAGSGTRYAAIAPQSGVQAISSGRQRIDSMAIHSGVSAQANATLMAYGRRFLFPRRYRCTFQQSGLQLVEHETVPIAPQMFPLDPAPFVITERMSGDELQERRRRIGLLFILAEGLAWPRGLRTYLEEPYYFVPIQIALQLQRRGHFIAALDWFRNVYDYSRPVDQRKIYAPLKQEESLSTTFQRADDWLLDPLDPHGIASSRANTYTRFTLISLVLCLLDYAGAEFTRDTAESVPRARTLYTTVLELLSVQDLNQRLGFCEDIVGTLDIDVGANIAANAPAWIGAWRAILEDLEQVTDRGVLNDTMQQIQQAAEANQPWSARIAAMEQSARQAALQGGNETYDSVLEKSRMSSRVHMKTLARSEVFEAAKRVGAAAASDFGRSVSVVTAIEESRLQNERIELPFLRQSSSASGGDNANRGGGNGWYPAKTWSVSAVNVVRRIPEISIAGPSVYQFCIPPNPLLRAQRLRAELNLHKIRTCRNISGLERQLEPYTAPTDTESGLPSIGAGGNLILPGTVVLQPTPYRYQALIERAKQLVQLAGQVEASMLAALEKRDAEYYQLLKARQDVQLTRAGIRLQDLRLREAEGGVKLAELQRESAQIQADHYQQLLDAGLSPHEKEALSLMGTAADFQVAAAVTSFGAAALHVAAAVAAAFPGGGGAPAVFSHSASALSSTSGALSSLSGHFSTLASIASTYASYERRAQDWELQRALAEQNIRIGSQQVRLAEDHVRVVGQERRIAEMQNDHAKETMEFLADKFTNVELYDWMSDVLEGVYSFFLQQATAVAKLAENQLAFERQDIAPAYIQSDYWEAPVGVELGSDPLASAPDRRGLTGSARLLQDIYQLDQYNFETKQRKHQLTKIVSLAQLDPFAFEQFRETGVLPFDTPMEMFDRDFPGHFLRLIKRIQVAVVALIPPTHGIKATLLNTGVSRVVVGRSGLFQESIIRRPPDSVALSSPVNASGVFELSPNQQEMLFPFEDLGVATSWELQMPKASNQFDYATLADVLLTIEYTALDSFDYRQEVLQRLDQSFSADRPFSFRHQFADAWYDLHNPDQTATPMTVQFSTRREDFPPNTEGLRILHVVLYFARADGATFEMPVTHLRFAEGGDTGVVGGGAMSTDGVISTRRGNAGSWTPMIGKSPIGGWELALPNIADVKNHFAKERIVDILLVITYAGRTPNWPGVVA